ncbi:MAG: YggT family protein [Magnetococcales bacterium]|nr:YggT family protein [Magnetococcales bacterium]
MGILGSVATLVEIILGTYIWLIVFRVLLSWVNPDPYNPIVQLLMRFTDPVLIPLRRVIPTIGGLDLSPIVALFGIQLLQRFLVTILRGGMGGGGGSVLIAEILGVIHLLGTFYLLILFVRAGFHVYSWYTFRSGQRSGLDLRHPVTIFVFQATEPAVQPLRRFVPTVARLDVTPLVAAFICMFLLSFIQEIIFSLAMPGMGAMMQ